MQPAIHVKNLGKQYKIGLRQQSGETFREAIVRLAATPLRRLRALGEHADHNEIIWALKDVSFQVKQGEVVGIIGPNGAGKSTLLKILSQITEPTEGRAEILGRVGSLLEVGTGFHPELTGRENVFLNGSILGMKKKDIQTRFDEIVAFAGVEKFLDTPIKRYSSGMHVRLAFAVAAHLQPELLMVDEVLAVGDAAFQKKCLGKMQDVAAHGRTVLFVSHNMSAIQTLTRRCIWLEAGQIAGVGPTSQIVERYLGTLQSRAEDDGTNAPRPARQYGTQIRICRITPNHHNGAGFKLGEDLVFEVELESNLQATGLRFGATIADITGTAIFSTFSPEVIKTRPSGRSVYQLVISDARLAPGPYTLALSIGEGGQMQARLDYDVVRPGPMFRVDPIAADGSTVFQWARAYGPIIHTCTRVVHAS